MPEHYLMNIAETFQLASFLMEENKFDEAIKYYLTVIERSKNVGENSTSTIKKCCVDAMFNLGDYYRTVHKYDLMKKYFEMAINKGDIGAMFNLSLYYYREPDYDNFVKYSLMVISESKSNPDKVSNDNDIRAMTNLSQYYKTINKDVNNRLKYLLMIIEKQNVDFIYVNYAATDLAYYYHNIEDYDNMVKYYLLIINQPSNPENNDNRSKAMFDLGYHYYEQKELEPMRKYYHLAIELENADAMNNIACDYEEQYANTLYEDKEIYDNMMKYFIMAITKGHSNSMYDLALFYEKIKDYTNMKKYLLMAANSKHEAATIKLADMTSTQD